MNRGFTYAAAIAIGLSLSGCNMFDDDEDNGDRTPVTDTTMYGSVPSGAMRATQGFDTIRYRASETGRVWIGNDTRRQVITEIPVQAGDEVVVHAGGDSVTVNERVVYNQNLQKNEQHSIFFLRN